MALTANSETTTNYSVAPMGTSNTILANPTKRNLPRKNVGANDREHREHEIRQYEDWAKAFREFLRDHRSQDVQDVVVHRITEDVCSECGHDWETDVDEDGKTCCAWCGTEIASEHGG